MIKTVLKYISVFGFAILGAGEFLYAQCPMCKASVESSSGSTSALAEGLNNGILYMLALPYVLIMVVGILWYRKWKQRKAADAAALNSQA